MKKLILRLRDLAAVQCWASDHFAEAADAIESQAATIARYETTAENYELLQAKVDERAREIERLKQHCAKWQERAANWSAMKAQRGVVVLPERASDANVDQLLEVLGWKADDDARADAIKVFNHALDEVARLNSSLVSADTAGSKEIE